LTNLLTRKLENFAPLSGEDRRFLAELARPSRLVRARTDLIREGDRPNDVRLVSEGFACRYKILPAGKRHIMAYLVPGDLCDLHVFILKKMDHSIGTLSVCLRHGIVMVACRPEPGSRLPVRHRPDVLCGPRRAREPPRRSMTFERATSSVALIVFTGYLPELATARSVFLPAPG